MSRREEKRREGKGREGSTDRSFSDTRTADQAPSNNFQVHFNSLSILFPCGTCALGLDLEHSCAHYALCFARVETVLNVNGTLVVCCLLHDFSKMSLGGGERHTRWLRLDVAFVDDFCSPPPDAGGGVGMDGEGE